MAGNGINDAPAPAQANAGIAFGCGPKITCYAVIMLPSSLRAVLNTHRMSGLLASGRTG